MLDNTPRSRTWVPRDGDRVVSTGGLGLDVARGIGNEVNKEENQA